MHTEFVVVLFVLSLAGCKCGLLNLFNEWTDEVEQHNPDIKCRERRETEGNRITSEITNSDPESIVSLMDIEEEKLTDETREGPKTTNSKAKRCPKNNYVGSIRNPILSSPHIPLGLLPMSKRESENPDQQMCAACMAQPVCKLFKKCKQCSKFCDNDEGKFDTPVPWDNQTVGMANRMAGPKSDITSKTFYPVSTYREGEAKDIICRIIGIPDAADIETVTIWVTTFSNKPPKIAGVMNELSSEDPRKQENLSELKLRQPESKQMSDNEGTQVLTDKKTLANPELKPRFNDYDEDYPMANTRNINENMKENPDLIEGPPPFLRSDGKDDTIIVQPKEFESDESNIDELLPKTDKPEELGPKPTLFSRFSQATTPERSIPVPDGSNLKSGPTKGEESKSSVYEDNVTNLPPSELPVGSPQTKDAEEQIIFKEADTTAKSPNINEALQEIKDLVKSLQSEAKKASDQRLLGSPLDDSVPPEKATDLDAVPSTSANMVQPGIPSHVVDNVHKVNKYFINRAQDALDTIRHPDENQPSTSNTTRDDHSDMTKRIITDIKKMPQFLLNKFKDTLEGFENKAKLTNSDAESQSEQEQVKLSNRIGDNTQDTTDATSTEPESTIKQDVNNGEEPVVGYPEIPDLNTESPTTKAFKNKLEKYFAEIKEKRQKMYSPDKYLKEVATTAQNVPEVSSSGDSHNPKSATENLDQKSNNPSILMSPYDLEQQRELLRDNLRKYIDTVVPKKTTSTLATTENLKTDPTPTIANNDLTEPNIVQASSLDTLTESPEQTVGAGLQSNDINHFLPTIPTQPEESFTEMSEKPNIFTKYLKNLKFGKPQNPLETDNHFLSTEKTALLKDKIKQYVSSLKTPETFQPTVSNINPKDLSDNLNKNLVATPQFSKTEELRDKLKNYVETLKNPVESRMGSLPDATKKFPALIRKSSEVQREELNALKRKLENLLKERVAQPMKSTFKSLPSPFISESEPKQETAFAAVSNGEGNEGEASTTRNVIEQVGASNPSDGVRDVDLQNRNGFMDENNLAENWSSSLGQIVQSSSQPKEIFFIGNGIKLPLQVKKGKDGSMDLSVDLEKLCSCYNSTCPKNHTAIEETVSAILEKEAELKEQLTLSPDPSSNDQRVKSNIFKRSSDTNRLNNDITTPNQDKLSLPFQEVVTEFIDASKQLQESFANSMQTLQNRVQNVNKEVLNSLDKTRQNIPLNNMLPQQTFNDKLNTLKKNYDKINNDLHTKFEHEKNLNQLLNANKLKPINGLKLNVNEYVKSLEREKTMKKLLQPFNLPQNPVQSTLNQMKNEETLRNAKNKLLRDVALGKAALATTYNPLLLANQLKDNLKNTLPDIPDLQNRFNDIDNNLLKMPDVYQYSKIDALKTKLEELNNKVEKYEESNERLFVDGSKKIFGGHKNKLVDQEMHLVDKVLSWFGGLSKSNDKK